MRFDDETLAALKLEAAPEKFLERLAASDPDLHAELMAKAPRPRPEAPFGPEGHARGAPRPGFALETLVRIGRPAFLVQDHKIVFEAAEAAAEKVIDRLRQAEEKIAPLLPLVGRIDVAGFANLNFVGTGWLIAPDIVVTNRHVAELIGARDGAAWRFHTTPRGREMEVSFDRRHEFERADREVSKIDQILWIETDPDGPDMALLKIERAPDGLRPTHIDLVEADLSADAYVAAIGYPARGSIEDIPDQEWMDRIYKRAYDIKRIAPGQINGSSGYGLKHDCTTLGGNSGSVVIDLDTCRAAALHYAGIYRNANFAVPASVLRKLRRERPSPRDVSADRRDAPAPSPQAAAPKAQASAATVTFDSGAAVVTVPITVTVTVTVGLGGATQSVAGAPPSIDIVEAARRLEGEAPEGTLAIRPGYRLDHGRLSDRPCLAAFVAPERFGDVALPTSYLGYEVEPRPASIDDQLSDAGLLAEEAVGDIAYDDAARAGVDFRFDPIEEPTYLVCHVGPERGWSELANFLGRTTSDLVSAIYQFEAAHVAAAIDAEIEKGRTLVLVMAPQTLDGAGPTPAGDFDREETFSDWERKAQAGFQRIVAPVGRGGLVMKAYHIKATVRDGTAVWLSSGNWTRTSQPLVPPGTGDVAGVSRRGNREWHVIAENRALARFFSAHIKADFNFAKRARRDEAAAPAIEIDVPVFAREAPTLERAPTKLFEPLAINDIVRITPLLTPDRRGAVYCDAVLALIESARKRLLFQNQYIDVSWKSEGRLAELVDALVAKSKEIDVFIILRSGGNSLRENVEELKRRGLDIEKSVRRLANTHTKGIVVDDEKALVGSQNWSRLGVTLNRDASLLIEHAAAARYFAAVFEEDWRRSLPCVFEPLVPDAAPRLARGDVAPQNFRRVALADWEVAG